jgi:2-O-(6-phospho-alpha-D-mannosyl)-D-glycerate hydrolase
MLDIHVISHTHWDREWYLTHEQFRLRLVALVDRLLDLLDADPSYKHFHLDGQTIVLEDYLEIRPEQEPRLRRAIEAGRILIGPWYVMPDEFLVSGESLVRNLVRGHRISRQYGVPMPVGYLPDLFGHVGQMPQIWRQFGLDNTILWRGFGGPNAEYWWDAPDGSRVLMMHLPPEGYCNATRIVFDPDAMMARADEKVGFERARTRTGQALLMNGVDHVEPHAAIPVLIDRLSSVADQRATHSTLPAYVDAVRRAVERERPVLETVTGELRSGTDYANLLPGVLSARVYLKQQNAQVQTLLESYAEPLSVFASRLGARYPAGELRYAWKTLLQNHPHDSICGCSIDAVHEENMTRFVRARQVATAVADRALDAIADQVPAAAPGVVRAIAVNPDLVERAQVVETFIDLPIDSAEPWRRVDAQALDRPIVFWPADAAIDQVVDGTGRPAEFQVVREERIVSHVMSRYETPWALNVRRLHVLWWAQALPPCGYAAFDLRIEAAGAARLVPYAAGYGRRLVTAGERSAENERVKLSVNDDGTFQVTDKASGVTYSRVAAFEDVGDVGDEYNFCPPASDRLVTSAEARVVRSARTVAGPLRAAFRVDLELALPASASGDRRQRSVDTVVVPVSVEATLDAGAPRVAFSVSVDNRARDHRLRILFPCGAERVDSARADTAFDVVARPARTPVPASIRNEAPVSSAPMISVVDAGDDEIGATVIGKGLNEYEIVSEPASIGLTLMRAVGDLSRDDLSTRPSGQAGPLVATPGAQCLGTYVFEMAFEPRGASPSAAEMLASARAHVVQPRVVVAIKANGSAPAMRSFLMIDRPTGGVVLSALKQAEDRPNAVVRLFNPGDREARATLRTDEPIVEAFALNLLEERQTGIMVENGALALNLKPHQIQTIEIVQGAGAGA